VIALPIALALQLATGKLLIATDKSHDPDLAKSVILLIHYDRDGAIGLILNRPVKDLYFGGPVALGARCLFRSTAKPGNAAHIFGDVYLATKPVAGGRVYAGYTGWSAIQLNDEISRGLWKIQEATTKIVFDSEPSTLWQRLTH
jgi:putative transcriptional regulator